LAGQSRKTMKTETYYKKNPKTQRQCKNCSEIFLSGIVYQIYCSDKCRDIVRNKRRKQQSYPVTCKQCKKTFYSGIKRIFCSKKCSYQYRLLNKQRQCLFCKNEFNASNIYRKFCSKTCYKSYWKIHPNRLIRDKKRQLEYKKARRKSSPEEKLKYNISDRVRKLLRKKKLKKDKRLKEVIGCSIFELKKHLENNFKNGMNWNNHTVKGWHIDHIKPLALAKTKEEIYSLWHYTNLRPLWWIDNLKKGKN